MKWSPHAPIIVLALACKGQALTAPVAPPGQGAESAPTDASPRAATTSIVVLDQAGAVGRYTSLVSSEGGRRHATYNDETNGDLKYATCVGNCTVAANWNTGWVDKVGNTGRFGSLEVAPGGRRHVSYYDVTNRDLKYATCAPTAACTTSADWTKARVDSFGVVGYGSSFGLSNEGAREMSYLATSYRGETHRQLKYAVCPSACGQASNWTRIVIKGMAFTTAYHGEVTSLAIGPDGRRHISYFDPGGGDLKYATCASGCTSAANWQNVTVDQPGVVGPYSSIAVGSDGIVHVSYYDVMNGDLKYARCALSSGCTTGLAWQKAIVRSAGIIGRYTSLAVDLTGRAHVGFTSHTGETGGALYYLTCQADCMAGSSWSGALLDGFSSGTGWYNSLAVTDGLVQMSYYDFINANLKYLERTP